MPDIKWLAAGAAGLYVLSKRSSGSEVQAGTVEVQESNNGTFNISPDTDPSVLAQFDPPMQRVSLKIDGTTVFHASRGDGTVTTELEYDFERGQTYTVRLEVEDSDGQVFVFSDEVAIPAQ